MKRYAVLFALTVLAALALAGVAARPKRDPGATRPLATPVAVVELALVISDGRLTPERAAVPKDHVVRASFENRGAKPVVLALAGYEDRLPRLTLAPGQRRVATFVADRPGEYFAWLLDGEPAGRLTVQGSHLVEGHR